MFQIVQSYIENYSISKLTIDISDEYDMIRPVGLYQVVYSEFSGQRI